MKRTLLTGLSILLLASPVLAQSTPPPILNYQGVLLSDTGAPENGDRDMEFHFFDDLKPIPPENEILVDSHLFVGGGAVTVINGMFNVHLGEGTVTDGTGPDPADGPYLELSRVFRDYAEVYLEVRVRVGPAGGGGAMETLLPRTRIVSSAYALNSHRLGGLNGTQFLRSDVADTKSAKLEMDTGPQTNASIQEDGLFRSSASPETYDFTNFGGGSMTLRVQGSPVWTEGNDGVGSGLDADLLDGSSSAGFLNTSATTQAKAGDLAVNSLAVNGPYLTFGSTLMTRTPGLLTVAAGAIDSDDLFLSAGNNLADGGLALFGGGDFELTSGDGRFSIRNGATAVETAVLNGAGDLQLDGDLTLDGSDLRFPTGGLVTGSTGALEIQGGSLFTDDLILKGGPVVNYGEPFNSRVTLFGNGEIELAPGNNTIRLHTPYGFLSYTTTLLLGYTGSIATTVNGSNADIVINPGGLGNLSLGNSSGDEVLVPGTLTVSGAKAFVQNHPYRHDLSIVYNALEGDEAGTYTRGSARLSHGVARVPLGETFAWVTSPDIGLTAHVTPRGGPAELYVESVTPTELVVRGASPASDDAVFDYIVHGLRVGYEKSRIVREKVMESTVPTDASYERDFARAPDLRRYSPIERFQKMETEVRGAPVAGFSASATLRRAIGEHDPEVDQSPSRAADRTPFVSSESTGKMPPPTDRGAQTGQAPAGTEGDLHAYPPTPVSAALVTSVPVSEAVELGDILVADREWPGQMHLGRVKADRAVVGIVLELTDTEVDPRQTGGDARPDRLPRAQVHVAFSGIVLCRADAGYGAIEVGDLLTASPTPGHAMLAEGPAAGTIVGKALEALDSGTGLIKVLVMLR